MVCGCCIHPTEYTEHGKCRPTFGLSSNIDIGFLLPCRGVAIVAPVLAYYSPFLLSLPSSKFSFLHSFLSSSILIFYLSTHDGGTGNSSTFYLHVGGFFESRQEATSNAFSPAHRSTFAVRTLNTVRNAVLLTLLPLSTRHVYVLKLIDALRRQFLISNS
jgi:hypothetical protein